MNPAGLVEYGAIQLASHPRQIRRPVRVQVDMEPLVAGAIIECQTGRALARAYGI